MPSEMVRNEGFGDHGEPCADCGAPLADDQRYCLNCGRRRAGERVAYAELLAGRDPGEVLAATDEPEAPPARRPGPGVLGGLAALASVFVLGLGVLIGLLARGEPEAPRPQIVSAPAQKAPVVNVTTAAGGPAAATEFVSDWPEGESGHTVQLETLPSTSEVTAVDTAKADAEAGGAADVGALSSDDYPSLEPGNYVVYSGVFTGKGSKKKATAARKKLKKDFPDAKVVEVSTGDAEFAVADEKPEEKITEVDDATLDDLQEGTAEERQKKSARLPDTIGIPGKPPPDEPDKQGGETFE